MATPDANSLSLENKEDHTPDHGLANLSLSSKTIHADDYLNEGTDVAPPMHVSTTFRYDRDPDKLKAWNERQVFNIMSIESRRNN